MGCLRIAVVGVVLEIQAEDRLQAVAQVLAALEADGAGGTYEIGVVVAAIVPVDHTGVDVTEDRDVSLGCRHATGQGDADHRR